MTTQPTPAATRDARLNAIEAVLDAYLTEVEPGDEDTAVMAENVLSNLERDCLL